MRLRSRTSRETSAGFGLSEVTPLEYLRSQPGVILQYLRLAFWPHPLCLDYGLWVARTVGEVLPGALVVAGLVGGTAWALRRHPGAGFLEFEVQGPYTQIAASGNLPWSIEWKAVKVPTSVSVAVGSTALVDFARSQL